MESSRRINLPKSTYLHLLGCKNEITHLFLNKFSCEVEFRGPEPNKSHAASVQAEKVYEKRTLGGPVVSVWKGDLTEQDADVVVNAANEQLDHAGGLARALVEAGGPIIEKDSKDYIKANGQIKTGEYAVTRPGNLPCKCLLHVVGPIWFKEAADRCDDELAESIKNVLKYVNQNTDIKSVAIPAVSSGIFGFPLQRCAEIIVKTIRSFLYTVTSSNLREIRLVNNNDPAVQAMKSACISSFGPSDDLSGATSGPAYQTRQVTRSVSADSQPSPTTSSNKNSHGQHSAHGTSTEMSQFITINGLTLHLKKGCIQEQSTTVIVNSLGTDLKVDAGQVSKALLTKAGYELQQEVNSTAQYLKPLPLMIPTEGYRLPCKFVFHVILQSRRLEGLEQAIAECLITANRYTSPSISFPALGTGNIGLSKKDVAKVMMNTVVRFAMDHQCSMNVYFVIHPEDTETYKAFQDRWKNMEWNKITRATEQRDPRPDLSGTSSNSRDSEIPCFIMKATSDEDAEEAESWLKNVLHSQTVSIQNNLVLLLGQEEHDILSSPHFPDVIIEEKLSDGKCLLEIDGLLQDKVKGVIQAELLLLDVQDKHAMKLEEELLEEAVVWLYENESGAQKYPAKANREIEKAFVTQRDITLKSEPNHAIFPKSLTAKGKDRAFRLERLTLWDSSKDVQKKRSPDDWLSQVVLVDPNSQEFQDYTKKFKKERLTLVKMERIHNRYLSRIFQSKKETKKTVQLYQVVPRQFTKLVCDVGFQRIFSNPKDPRLGQGIYFTDTPRRAVDVFQIPKEESGLICIFQAEVLTDNSTEGRRDLPVLVSKKSPFYQSKPADILDLYDSLVNYTTSPSIYAVADSFRANPLCLFTCRSSRY